MSITVVLKGGMGNQLFQYSMGYAQAKRLGVEMQLDISRVPDVESTDFRRVYMLGRWVGVREKIVTGVAPTLYESGFSYNPKIDERVHDNMCIEGYWQSEKYFKNHSTDIRHIFLPKTRPTSGQVAKDMWDIWEAGERSIFLTVRRTDYIGNTFHGEMDMNYYLDALELVAQRVNPKVFVFSDDPAWVQDNFKLPYEWRVIGGDRPTTTTHNGQEEHDLTLMASCQHAVMANSSFSWWGAWLGETKQDQVIVAPKRWFLDKSMDTSDLIPERWIRI